MKTVYLIPGHQYIHLVPDGSDDYACGDCLLNPARVPATLKGVCGRMGNGCITKVAHYEKVDILIGVDGKPAIRTHKKGFNDTVVEAVRIVNKTKKD